MINLVKRFVAHFFSAQPKFYNIPFGPNKGMKLFTSFNISPRMLFGFDETWVVKIAKQYISKGDTVYDVGAHIGYTSLLFAKLVGANGKVHAFELLPSVANNYLSKTINKNQLAIIVDVHAIGLSNRKQDIDVFLGETMMGNLDLKGYETKYLEKCHIETLDQYLIDNAVSPPNLIKVDIERAELQFLEGARITIEKFQPTMIIEFHNLDLLRAGHQLLTSMNYKLSTANGMVNDELLASLETFYGNVLALPSSETL